MLTNVIVNFWGMVEFTLNFQGMQLHVNGGKTVACFIWNFTRRYFLF